MSVELLENSKREPLALTDLLPVKDLLLAGNCFRFRVAGWSMFPALCKGDRLTIEPARVDQLCVGDLLVFQHQGPLGRRLMCHRLIAFTEDGQGRLFLTRGDAVTGPGETVFPSAILGRVVSITRSWPWSWLGAYALAAVKRLDEARMRLAPGLSRWRSSGRL